MKTIAIITEEEHSKLKEAYTLANSTDSDKDWIKVAGIYNRLGKKYHFNPDKVTIDMRGNVSTLPSTQYSLAIYKHHENEKPELYIRRIITPSQIAKIKRIFR